MSSVSAIALSGMNAANVSMDSAAHNIANLGTRDFRRQTAVQETSADGGVSSSVTRASQAGNAPEQDLVGLLQSKNAFLMNLSVFKTADAMMGSLLDTTD
jgi:flagellar hook protein FlgE